MPRKRTVAVPDLRQQAREALAENFPSVVEGLIAAAAKGNWQAAKFLIEISGVLSQADESNPEAEAAAFVTRLCDDLKLASAEIASAGKHSELS